MSALYNILVVGEPLICISKYGKNYGLSIRYYKGIVNNEHVMFATCNVKGGQDNTGEINFKEFAAVVPYENFNPRGDINFYLNEFKTS